MKSMSYSTLTIEEYIEEKIDMLKDKEGFNFKLTKSEIWHLRNLTTEGAVDRYVRDLFKKYL